MKKILATALLVTFALTGCNTIKGVGKDVSKAGQAVTGTAEKTSDEIRRNQFYRNSLSSLDLEEPYLNRVFLCLNFPLFC